MAEQRSKNPTALGPGELTRLAEIFHLIGDQSRLTLLLGCLDGPIAAGHLAAAAGLSPSLASHHLRLLRAAHLVRAERHGKEVRYAVDDQHVRRVLEDMMLHLAEERHDG